LPWKPPVKATISVRLVKERASLMPGLDRLRAAAEKLDAVEPAGRELREEARELGARARGEAPDGHRRELGAERGHIFRMRVAQAGHRHAGVQIDVRIAVEIDERRTLSPLDGELGEQRDRLQAGRDVALLFVKERFGSRS
jgi:hypothetical protein